MLIKGKDVNVTKQGKVTLVGDINKLLFSPFNKSDDELKRYAQQFGWLSSDYNQAILQDPSKAIAQPEDFIPFMFRHISACIVGAGSWKATEFTEASLKDAVRRKLLDNKPSYVNHELDVGNIIGVAGASEWQPGFKDADGTQIPGGIIAPIWIDKVCHTDLCRKLTAFPVPHIQSVSITVAYEWEPSHLFEGRDGEYDYWMFEDRVGQMVDGKMVRRIVTNIIEIYETSLVWLGADPIAKVLDENNKPINVERSAIVDKSAYDKDPLKFLYDKEKSTGSYFVADNNFTKQNTIDLTKNIFENLGNSGNLNTDEMKNEVALKIAEMLGKKPEEITLADLTAFSKIDTASKEKIDGYDQLKKDHDTHKTNAETAKANLDKYAVIVPLDKLDELKGKIKLESVVVMAEYGVAQLDKKRKDAVRLYKLKVKEADQTPELIAAIEGSDEKTVDGYIKQYGGGVLEEFEATCTKCGNGDSISMRSSVETDETKKKESKTAGTGGHMIDGML